MDNTSICNASLLDITRGGAPALSYMNLGSKLVFLREKEGSVESEALLAVKLDPAVLEAQVTIENEKKDIKIFENPEKIKDPEENVDFEKAMSIQRAALFSLSSQQFSLLMKYVDTIRQQRLLAQKKLECGFCKKSGHPEVWYTTHSLKDGKGRVTCPILRAFTCRRCGATGDRAHTFKYCPLNYF